jgi:hypothetical protein
MSGRLKILILVLVVASGVRLTLAAWDWLEEKAPVPKAAAAAIARMQTKDRPYIDVGPKARAKLLENVKKVKIGDSTDEVYEKLGKPQADLPPTARPSAKEVDHIVHGSQIVAYYIRQKKADQLDEDFDEHIYIFLDQDDLVEYIYVLRQDQPKPVKYPKLPAYVQDKDKKPDKK